jgi:D-alanine-D-alanine ligase
MPENKFSSPNRRDLSNREGGPPTVPEVQVATLAVVVLHNVDPSWPPTEKAVVMDAVSQLVTALTAEGHRVFEAPVTSADLAAALAPFNPGSHIVFNWCDELPGIQKSEIQVAMLLEQLGYTYTGSPPETLSLSWDKGAVKSWLSEYGVPIPYGQVVNAANLDSWHRFPAIVKPAFEHCSVGIDSNAVVLDKKELQKRVAHVRKVFAQPAVVEDFIDGREFHVTLWGNSQVHMLPPAEMDFSDFSDVRDRLCTFDSKFTPGSRHYDGIKMIIPAPMAESDLGALRQTSVAAYTRLGCRDYARIDLRLRDEVFYVLDINPNADISPDTSLAYAAEASMGYGAFASRLIRLASERHPGDQRRRLGYDAI